MSNRASVSEWNKKGFGRAVRDLRGGQSQRDMARALKLSHTTIQRWENGEQTEPPTTAQIDLLVDTYGPRGETEKAREERQALSYLLRWFCSYIPDSPYSLLKVVKTCGHSEEEACHCEEFYITWTYGATA